MGHSVLLPDARPLPFRELPAAAIGSGYFEGRPERKRVHGNAGDCRFTLEDRVVAM